MNTVLRWYEQHIELAAALGIELGTGFDLEQAPATQTATASATALSPAKDPETSLSPQNLRPAESRRRSEKRRLYLFGSYLSGSNLSHPATSPSHKGQRHRSGLH
ncbi:hypothetical protein R70723_04475 [Paenibacillus sp. FSL R7-0273]|uniref:hypothetical protein n=1 Tax=Paenibacillus sp. FSL R7-0273 TaxID=1536772 RepID=UPI0004F64904|nr:hypothetical protein [Paenibacillus sp. FSL R7-0273]AIQ45230.1 hypothetical protein R70723_04475 [Paenibacillus sp. FSL R7-0273]OMF86148.1 hypothetical protein BK144_26495 [Paenibacillus sp. FSL R7-0273]